MKELQDVMNKVWAMAIAKGYLYSGSELLKAYKHLNDAYEILNRDDE
tara:strand:- start:98 stop:238 length:141 start_codon:yes stop_codon:yes gene_type:complete